MHISILLDVKVSKTYKRTCNNGEIAKKMLSECMENSILKDGCFIKGLMFSERNLKHWLNSIETKSSYWYSTCN